MSGYREEEDDAPVVVAAFGGQIYGIEAATGNVLWEQGVWVFGADAIALTVASGVIVAATDESLACFRYPDGEPLWKVATRARGRSSLLVVGRRIHVTKAGEMECYSLEGELLWGEHTKFRAKGAVAMAVSHSASGAAPSWSRSQIAKSSTT